jgi:uncharacterized protein
MGIRDSYENGVFSWVDLATSAPEDAKQFYSQLFHWDFQDLPMDGGQSYSMAFKEGRSVAALFLLPNDLKAQQIPPHWQCYITVQDLDATVQSWRTHGGTVLSPPYDVQDAGRMAVVQDPTGAIVSLWQAKGHIGAGLVNEVNTFCWAELQTRGADRAAEFYQSVLNWEIEVDEKPPHYVMGKVKGKLNCGMFDMDQVNLPGTIPVRWAAYFNVENLDATLEQASQLGGKVLMPPIAIDPGRFATIADPQGATLTLIELIAADD